MLWGGGGDVLSCLQKNYNFENDVKIAWQWWLLCLPNPISLKFKTNHFKKLIKIGNSSNHHSHSL
jgi:hypothetical protein